MSRRLGHLLAAGLLAVAGACSGSDGSGAPDTSVGTTSTVPATTVPPGPPPGAVATGLRDLAVGDCFDRIDDPTVSDRAVWVIPCTTAHIFEVYEVLDYEGETDGGAYPGGSVVQDWAEQACFDRFEAFVGVRWTISELDIQLWWPTAESWGVGDDTVVCTVRDDGGDALTGTQRDSRR